MNTNTRPLRIRLIAPRMALRPVDSNYKRRMAPSLSLLTVGALTPPPHIVTLEDETGLIEITVFERIYQRWGKVIFSNDVLVADGILQKRGRYGTVVLGRCFQGLQA